jgi:hypothetical protein
MDEMVIWLRQKYESIFEDGSGVMKISRRKVHQYLGMTCDFAENGRVKISMFDYVDEILATFDKADPKGGGTKTSAAPGDLFKVDEDSKKLGKVKTVEFYNIVAKTQFATKRARPDTSTSVAFLSTRVRAPDHEGNDRRFHDETSTGSFFSVIPRQNFGSGSSCMRIARFGAPGSAAPQECIGLATSSWNWTISRTEGRPCTVAVGDPEIILLKESEPGRY